MTDEYQPHPSDERFLSGPFRHPNFVTCATCWALVDANFMEMHATHTHPERLRSLAHQEESA